MRQTRAVRAIKRCILTSLLGHAVVDPETSEYIEGQNARFVLSSHSPSFFKGSSAKTTQSNKWYLFKAAGCN